MKRLIFFLACLSMTNFTHAANTWCTGIIGNTYISADGTLVILGSWRRDYTTICNVNSARGGVAPETCKSWLSMALSAKLSQTEVTLMYGGIDSCETLPTYGSAPTPSYLMVRE